ncbi:MAG: hypothetical protein OXF33_00270 [Rhodospirillales bacterium]|nr:hypothetical protein [Rhodospirillales bacterium]
MTNLASFLHDAIEDWIARQAVSGRRFGEVAVGDPCLVAELRRGRSLRLRTADRLLAFMGMEPVGAAFRSEVEVFLAASGLKVSLFGELAAGDPSFVARLRRGASPTLAKVDRVRTWMAAYPSDGEHAAVAALLAPTASQPMNKENLG